MKALRTPDLTQDQLDVLAERLWASTKVVPGECWLWEGRVNDTGHGYLCALGKTWLVHRISFRLANGHWAAPLTRHLCGVPGCVNPAHMAPGNARENYADRRADPAYSTTTHRRSR